MSSDSIPLLPVALIANCFGYFQNLIFGLFYSISLLHCLNQTTNFINDAGVIGSNLVSLIALVEQLNLNKVFHKDGFDGWLHHLKFNCPLCPSPLKVD
ncbi:hypothetical protein CXB51_004379 [Gossypium anomalum]|uniref:Uncharacterized protein n=1 Tax=Gossypium anomalum TaxID=47600 RepID=A0A8J5Z4P3_9ROSI|nr:hypothetical protein CXB51_004379 [Gossypium anomalum]